MNEYEQHQVNMIAIGLYQKAGGGWVSRGPVSIPKDRDLLDSFVEVAKAIRANEVGK